MKIKKFNIAMYNWKITFVEITSKKDIKKVDKILSKFKVKKESRKTVKENIRDKCVNGGNCFWNNDYHKTLIFLYPSTSKKTRQQILSHEKRHCEDSLLEHLNIKDFESAACLSGFLGKKLFKK